MNNPRLKRKTPERTGPIRNPLFWRPAPQDLPPDGQTNASGAAPCASSDAETVAGLQNALECGVRTAYTVIDQYIQRGYEAARACKASSTVGEHMNNRPFPPGSGPNPWGAPNGPMEPWAAAVRAWTEMWMTAFAPAMRGQWPNPWQPQPPWPGQSAAPPSTHAATSAPPSVSVRVASRRRTEVEANLTSSAEYGLLVADVPGLSGLSISRETGRVLVSLEVADQQPSGHFHGCIRAGGGEVGHFAVTIWEPEESQAGLGESFGKHT